MHGTILSTDDARVENLESWRGRGAGGRAPESARVRGDGRASASARSRDTSEPVVDGSDARAGGDARVVVSQQSYSCRRGPNLGDSDDEILSSALTPTR